MSLVEREKQVAELSVKRIQEVLMRQGWKEKSAYLEAVRRVKEAARRLYGP